MKQLYFIFVTILLTAGCSKFGIENSSTQESLFSPEFYAQIEDNTSRTYLDGLLHQRWNKNDQISVFTSTVNQKYQFDGNNGDNNGTFSVVSGQHSGANNPLTIDANIAVYPYNYETSISPDGTISLMLPWEQFYSEKSFGLGANPMLAVTKGQDDTDLNFSNLCGFLRLRLYGNDITISRITLHGNSDEKLHGRTMVSAKYGETPMITMSEEAYNGTSLYCNNGIKIGTTKENATDFWFVIPPTIFENGFYLYIEDINGMWMHKSLWDKFSIERNVVKSMTPFEVKTNGIHVSQYTHYIGTNGGYVDVDVQLAGDLHVNIPEYAQSWVKRVDNTRAIHDEKVRFEISPSESGVNRSCDIWLDSRIDDESYSQVITINQGDAIIIDNKDIMVGSDRGDFSFEIQATVEYKVSNPNVDWIRPVTTRSSTIQTFKYEYDANPTHDIRKAQIIVTNIKNNKSETVTITQAQKDAIVVSKNVYDIDCKGEQIQIVVNHNVEFDIEIPNSWITQIETRGLSTQVLTFNIAQNTAYKDRTGTIKFIAKDNSAISQTITIHQFGENAFDPSIDGWESDDEDYGGSAK